MVQHDNDRRRKGQVAQHPAPLHLVVIADHRQGQGQQSSDDRAIIDVVAGQRGAAPRRITEGRTQGRTHKYQIPTAQAQQRQDHGNGSEQATAVPERRKRQIVQRRRHRGGQVLGDFSFAMDQHSQRVIVQPTNDDERNGGQQETPAFHGVGKSQQSCPHVQAKNLKQRAKRAQQNGPGVFRGGGGRVVVQE